MYSAYGLRTVAGIAVSTALGLMVAASAASAQAQNDGKSTNNAVLSGKKAERKESVVSTAALAYDLFNFGKEKGDALHMASASRILASVYDSMKIDPAKGEIDHEGEAAAAEGGASPDPASMLAEARAAAAGNDVLLAAIDQPAATDRAFVSADQVFGRISTVGPNREDPWKWRTAYANEWAEVAISGNGNTDLDLYVYDENGNEVCRSVEVWDEEYCSFNPIWTGGFRIVVVNYGSSANTYQMWIQ